MRSKLCPIDEVKAYERALAALEVARAACEDAAVEAESILK
jgi:hypothetical protein